MDLDDILESALQEVEKEEETAPTSSTSSSSSSQPSNEAASDLSKAAEKTSQLQTQSAEQAKAAAADEKDDEFSSLLKMLGGEGGADLEKALDEAFKDLDLNGLMEKLAGGAGGEEAGGGASSGGAAGGEASGGGGNSEMDELARLLKLLGTSGEGQLPAAGNGGNPEEIMDKLVSKLENELGESGMEKMMQGMMKQMFSKEVMYEPVCQITKEYPKYFTTKGASLSREDRTRYEAQFRGYSALKKVYEETPEEFETISKIMQDLQAFGQPPEELMKHLAPANPLGGPLGGAAGAPGGMTPPPPCPTQ